MICHQYKCIFVHIPKTAGQSIETVFLNNLGLSWKNRAPLLLMKNDNAEIGPPRLAHLTIKEYVRYRYLSKELLSEYFKFSFIRNPWDRIVSFYHYFGLNSQCSFNDFIQQHFQTLYKENYWFLKSQFEFISVENYSVVDFLGRFENLQADFDVVCKKLGIENSTLFHKNKSNHSNLNYRDYYDETSIRIVRDLYKQDIYHFEYEF